MHMNSYKGKQLLSLIREGDYAHAGEEAAIELALRNEPKRPDQLILDVGCGRGGTAKYVHDHGWGKVVGLDWEPNSIARAREVYPDIEFHACDVVDAASMINRKFDLIYFFNSFYAFGDQARALAGLSQLAKESTRLVIFDYTDRGGYADNPLVYDGKPFIPHPLHLDHIVDLFKQTSWELLSIEDISPDYDRWYDALVQRMDQKRDQLIGVVGAETVDHVRMQYMGLLKALRDGILGGAIVIAKHR